MQDTISADALIEEAERSTGLRDWGEQDFRTGLTLFLDEAPRTARMTPEGWQRMLHRIRGLLANRLQLVDYRNRHPEVARQQITRPIFIIGLPRSGTSNLLSLLASDPAHRVPRMWEMYRSVPPPRRETYDSDPRIAEVQQLLKHDGFDAQALQATHPFDAQLPEECAFIFEHTFATMTFPAYVHVPDMADYAMNRADWRSVYGFHRRFLQHLQTDYAGERWVLKTPEHAHFLPDLLATYPDAVLLYTHREPANVMSSLASNISELRRLWSDDVDSSEVAREFLAAQAEQTRRMVASREDPTIDARFFDIAFDDLVERPVAVMEQVYARFGLPMSDAARDGFRHYADHQAKKVHGHGGHKHTLEHYGYTNEQIEAAFAPYLSWYRGRYDAIRALSG